MTDPTSESAGICSSALIGVSASILHADPQRKMYNGRPLLYLEQSMATWLMQAGARPYVIPLAPGPADTAVGLEDLVAGLDGVVLQGGVDVAPQSYGQEEMADEWPGDPVRDAYEIELVRACLELDKPLLGICRGHQILNVALGGTLHQDIFTQVKDAIDHVDRTVYEKNHHRIGIEPNSRLARIYAGQIGASQAVASQVGASQVGASQIGDNKLQGLVNSVHHQAIDVLADALVVEARAVPDGVVEAVRLDDEDQWAMGVQWHPEFQHADESELLDRFGVVVDFLRAVDRRRKDI
jgi:putative glutamine amidotransferase